MKSDVNNEDERGQKIKKMMKMREDVKEDER